MPKYLAKISVNFTTKPILSLISLLMLLSLNSQQTQAQESIYDRLPNDLRRQVREKMQERREEMSDEERRIRRQIFRRGTDKERNEYMNKMTTDILKTMEEGQELLNTPDHAGIIRAWNNASYKRGEKIYKTYCFTCHGVDGTAALPAARSFNKDPLKAGNDPYNMWKTLTEGYNQMVPQLHYNEVERYDVVHYIMEGIMKENNPDNYFEIDEVYLSQLPKGLKMGSNQKLKGHPRDYGPVITSQIGYKHNLVATVKLDKSTHISYDILRMTQLDSWEGYLDLSSTQHMKQRGSGYPEVEGNKLKNLQTYYWCYGDDFTVHPPTNNKRNFRHDHEWDESPATYSQSPLPKNLLDYHGYYLHGRSLAFSYAIQGREVMEMPGVNRPVSSTILEHTFRIEPGQQNLRLCVGKFNGSPDFAGLMPLEGEPDGETEGPATDQILFAAKLGAAGLGQFVAASVIGDTDALKWEIDNKNRLGLHIGPSNKPFQFKLIRFNGESGVEINAYKKYISDQKSKNLFDLLAFKKGGPRLWNKEITSQGKLNVKRYHYDPVVWRDSDEDDERGGRRRRVWVQNDPAYVYDNITVPQKNPWNAWLRTSALDFFDDGRCAIATMGGDVWIVSGLDDTLKNVKWNRFAAGMFEPMGIKVIKGEIYVCARDGIIKLHDLNKDGEADFYETFFQDPEVPHNWHSYNFDLHTDNEGYLYFAKCGRYSEYTKPGAILKIAPDGKSHEMIAHGLRVPNGMLVDGKDVYVSGQEGNWVPSSRITYIPPGLKEMPFLGVSPTDTPLFDDYLKPMLWLPKEIDNSSGGHIIADHKRFGPLSGKMIHSSFGKGWLMYVMMEDIEGIRHGSTVTLPFQFEAGVQRVRVNPVDGQVYTVGITGWSEEIAEKDGVLCRVRYTGKKAYMIDQTHIKPDGIEVKFTFEVDRNIASRTQSYKIQQWNYEWTYDYGSPMMSVRRPGREGVDTVKITSATVSEDGKSVLIKYNDMKPADQIYLRVKIKSADGSRFDEAVYLTIHKIPAKG